MFVKMRSAILLLAFAAACSQAYKTYDGFVVLETEPLDRRSALLVREVVMANHEFSFWRKEPRYEGQKASILSSPEALPELEIALARHGVEFGVRVPNVGVLIRESMEYARSPRQDDDWFADYHTYEETTAWVNQLADDNDGVETVIIGQSYEGRDMTVLQINRAGDGAPTVWVEAGIHAREWISPAVAQYFIDQLINGDEGDQYTSQINFHILVNTNPDGYAFTWTDDRNWRKTRSDQGSPLGCIGADPNRNFPVDFGNTGVGTTPCADTWPGPEAFSEIETANVRDYVERLSPLPTATFAMHSAANTLLYPYSYWFVEAENGEQQSEVGNRLVDAINQWNEDNGNVFTKDIYTCKLSALLYPASGDASDYYYDYLGATFSYLIELRDEAEFGFELPPSYILPSGQETWAGFKVLLDEVIQLS